MKDIPGHTGEEGSSGEFALEQRLILNVRDFRRCANWQANTFE
jgi:hypothetical protein